jgi:hypothetical protein
MLATLGNGYDISAIIPNVRYALIAGADNSTTPASANLPGAYKILQGVATSYKSATAGLNGGAVLFLVGLAIGVAVTAFVMGAVFLVFTKRRSNDAGGVVGDGGNP